MLLEDDKKALESFQDVFYANSPGRHKWRIIMKENEWVHACLEVQLSRSKKTMLWEPIRGMKP